MRNAAHNPWLEDTGHARSVGEHVDEFPVLRLALLGTLLVLPLLAVAGRALQLQTALRPRFLAEYQQPVVREEELPTHHGRILTADGQVLAEDVEDLQLAVHYRWLEEPAAPAWLVQQARSRLTASERRHTSRVAAEAERVLSQRTQMWQQLSGLTGRSLGELRAWRSQVQARIERMRRGVEERRALRWEPSPPATAVRHAAPRTWGEQVWSLLREMLTTPPERTDQEPLVLAEELEYHPLPGALSLRMAAEIEAHPERYPGCRVLRGTRRVYPQGELAAHVVGYSTPAQAEDLLPTRGPAGEHPLDLRLGEMLGRTGIEQSYASALRGTRGIQRVHFDHRGEVQATHLVRRPRPGQDVVLTLDAQLQRDAESLLDRALQALPLPDTAPAAEPPLLPQGGSLIVMDVRTGEILVLAAAPRFSPELLQQGTAKDWDAVLADPRKPLFPRPWQTTLPPGSVFKVVTAAALLAGGQIDPDRAMDCAGFLDHPRSHRCLVFTHFGVGHGPTDLTAALAQSCNVYFFRAARQLGPEPLYDWGQAFGFGVRTGIDLPGERSGHLPEPPGRRTGPTEGRKQPWYPGDTLSLGIGQGALTATPLQIVRMMAAVANGGDLVTPHVVRQVGQPRGGTEADPVAAPLGIHPLRVRRLPELPEDRLARIQEGLEQVIAHPRGTGYKTVRLNAVRIAGKTGTAEVAGRPDHAWFAGYVPADRPKYALVAVLEHAGSGGRIAGPLAREMVECLLRRGWIVPPPDTPNPGTELTGQ